jgi:hypothetical protein
VGLEERQDGLDEGIRQGAQPVLGGGAACTGLFAGGIHGSRGGESWKQPVAIKNATFEQRKEKIYIQQQINMTKTPTNLKNREIIGTIKASMNDLKMS